MKILYRLDQQPWIEIVILVYVRKALSLADRRVQSKRYRFALLFTVLVAIYIKNK